MYSPGFKFSFFIDMGPDSFQILSKGFPHLTNFDFPVESAEDSMAEFQTVGKFKSCRQIIRKGNE